MNEPQIVELRLSRNSVGQIIDGLEVLEDQWRETAEFYETGAFNEDTTVRECSGAREARNIQATYRDILAEITGQLGR